MLNRRTLLGLGALAVTGAVLPASAQVAAADQGPPPSSPDAYGLAEALGSPSHFDDVLRKFGEPAILTKDAKLFGATFRITEDYSLRRPRTARIIFLPGQEGRALAVIKTFGATPEFSSKTVEALRYFDGPDGVRLRALIDDEERFWNASPNPPDWDAISCEARNGGRPCPPPLDGGASLLEGRVGPKRHAILRKNPDLSELVQQVARAVF